MQNQSEKPEPKMITIDRVKAENFMLAIEQCVGDIKEQRALVDLLLESKNKELQKFQDDTIIKFNALIDATVNLKEKISATAGYEEYLMQRVENGRLTQEVALLQQQLEKEKAEISLFIRDITNTVTLRLTEMDSRVKELKTVDEIVEKDIAAFMEKIQDSTKKITDTADKQLTEISGEMQKSAKGEYAALKAQCVQFFTEYTDQCQKNLDAVKKQSLDFLKQCQNENKKLIEKVPVTNQNKISKKDTIILAVAGVSIIFNAIGVLFLRGVIG